MLEFRSGSSTAVNSNAAVEECLEHAFGTDGGSDCSVLIIHATMGHDFGQVLGAAKAACPNADIVGCTGSGVIGREGVSEAMRAMAVMAVLGKECAVASADGLTGTNSAEMGKTVASRLREKDGGINMVYVLSGGLDLCGDRIIDGIESVFGASVPIFGATAADNGKAKGTFQFNGTEVMENGIVMVGFFDPSLEVLSGVHHGSVPVEGITFEVTKSEGNHVIELDGQPAWPALLSRLGLPAEETEPAQALPIAGLGQDLNADDQAAYDNPQILSVPVRVTEDHQSFFLPASAPVGTRFVLMQRDEQHIFDGVDRLMERLVSQLDGRRPAAVFHADCMARGRHMFNRVLKDEIIAKMQHPICGDDVVPWLGVCGFSEFCRFADKNRFHSYTTSLFPIVRREGA